MDTLNTQRLINTLETVKRDQSVVRIEDRFTLSHAAIPLLLETLIADDYSFYHKKTEGSEEYHDFVLLEKGDKSVRIFNQLEAVYVMTSTLGHIK